MSGTRYWYLWKRCNQCSFFEGNVRITGDIVLNSGSSIVIGSDSGSDQVLMADASGNLYWGNAFIRRFRGYYISYCRNGFIRCGTSGDVTLSFNTTWGDARYVNEGQAASVTAEMLVDGAALAEILDDDGHGSGLDADLLDGHHASDFSMINHTHCSQSWSCADSGLSITATRRYGFWGTTSDSAMAGIRGDGGTRSSGVLGRSSSGIGGGVYGVGLGTEGVLGVTSGYLRAGVLGIEPSDTIGFGVYGYSDARGIGVFGLNKDFVGSFYVNTAVTGLSNDMEATLQAIQQVAHQVLCPKLSAEPCWYWSFFKCKGNNRCKLCPLCSLFNRYRESTPGVIQRFGQPYWALIMLILVLP
jgi:hypothetical protein